MENKKIKEIALDLTVDRNDYMSAFRKNIFRFIEEKDITLSDISEAADIPFSTLRTFLYGTTNDCKLSTAVKLAKAFGISIDELVGAGTIEDGTRTTIALARTLKDHHRQVIRLFAKHQYELHGNVPPTSKQISILLPECKNGHLETTNITEAVNIDHLPSNVRADACLALKIPCDHYEPFYLKGEILVLGAHRLGYDGERCIISKNGKMYICIKKIETIDGVKKTKYISLLTGKNVLFTSDEIDDRIGYVIGFMYPDGKWGAR